MMDRNLRNQNIIIQQPKENELDEIVAMHRRVLGYTLNSKLGQQHLNLLYSTMLRNPDCFVALARCDGESVGFISGTLNPESVKSNFMKLLPMAYWAKLAFRFLISPIMTLDFWYGMQVEEPVYQKGILVIPTLTTVGVEERFQGLGVGKKLVTSLEEFFRQKGVSTYRLDTLLSNQNARNFYSKIGFIQVAERANSVVLTKSLENTL